MNINGLNSVLAIIIIVLVIVCLLRNEHFQSGTTSCGTAINNKFVELSPFHPEKDTEKDTEIDTNNYMYAMTTDNHKIYGLGSDMSKLSNVTEPVAANSGD
tara:strand:+ start:459 stop:761 length:303 start_codon:yes stop_codon:yes gene_type:complete